MMTPTANGVQRRTQTRSWPISLLDSWEHTSRWARGFGLIGAFLALALLCGFYIVVAGAVHRAEAIRQQARLEIDRQAACSVYGAASSRELCAVTVASQSPPNVLVPVAYEQRTWRPRKPQLTAGLN